MGCVRSKPIRDQVEEEDGCVFEGPKESYSFDLQTDPLIKKESFESSSDVRFLTTKLNIKRDSAVTANELGAEPTDVPSDNTKDRTSDDGNDVMTVEMQLLREISKLQMAALKMARNRLRWSIIQRDAKIVAEALKKSQSFFEESAVEYVPNCGGVEMSLKNDDAIESMQNHSEPSNDIAIWVLDVVLGDIDYDGLNDGGKDEELISDDEDADLSDFEDCQFQRANRFRMTIRRPKTLPPSPLKVCTESNDLGQKASREQNKLPPLVQIDISGASTSNRDINSEKEKSISNDIKQFPENTIDDASNSNRNIDSEKEKSISNDIKLFPENAIDDDSNSPRDIDSEKEKSISNDIKLFSENTIDDASTSNRDIDSEKEKSISNDIKLFSENTIDDASTSPRDIDSEKEKSISKDIKQFPEYTNDIDASTTLTTEVLISNPECTVQSASDNDLDLTNEKGGALVNGHDNEADQVPSKDTSTEPSRPDDEETRIDEDREKRRLQWLARRKTTIPSAYVQPEISLDAKPREIDIDSAMARKKFPWMRI